MNSTEFCYWLQGYFEIAGKDVTLSTDQAKIVQEHLKLVFDGDAELVFNDSEYKVVIPHSHKASCYFGKNTRWCTTAADDARYHDKYSKDGPLYIILHKPTNKRWQFHFESQQYMNEKDENIEIIPFLIEHKKIFGVFKKLGMVDYKNDSFKIGKSYFNKDGKYHREDGPAIEYANGYKAWFLNGKRHREDGPAVEYASGNKSWYLNDKVHRTDGPAIERADGSKEWWLNGERHREDGPAIEHANGNKRWFLNDERVEMEDVMGKKS